MIHIYGRASLALSCKGAPPRGVSSPLLEVAGLLLEKELG